MPSEFNIVYYEAVIELDVMTYGPDAREYNSTVRDLARLLDFKMELDGFGRASLVAHGPEFQELRVRKDALLDSLRVAGVKLLHARIVAVISMEIF